MGMVVKNKTEVYWYFQCKKQLFASVLKNKCKLFYNPANIYLFKVNNRDITKRREICSKLIIKTSERPH